MKIGARTNTQATNEKGATLVELLVVVALVGILSNVAIHSTLESLQRARAVSIVADYRLVRDATFEYYLHAGRWPADTDRTERPPELRAYLQQRVRWTHSDLGLVYEWENWVSEAGEYEQPQTGVARGFSVVIPDDRSNHESIFSAIQRVYDGPVVLTARNQLTFVIDPIVELPEDESAGGGSGGGNRGVGQGNGGGNGTGNEGNGQGPDDDAGGGNGGGNSGGNSGVGQGNGGGNGTGNEGNGRGPDDDAGNDDDEADEDDDVAGNDDDEDEDKGGKRSKDDEDDKKKKKRNRK